MSKKGILAILILLFAGLIVLFYFINRGSKIITTDPYSAVPKDAAILIESDNLPSLLTSITEGNILFSEIARVKNFERFSASLRSIRDFISKGEILPFFDRNKAVISIISDSLGNSFTLLSANVPPGTNYRKIREALRKTGIATREHSYLKNRMITIIPGSGKLNDTVHLTFVSGLVLASGSEKSLQKVISGITGQDDVRNVPGFSRVRSAAGKGADKLFVNYRNSRYLFSPLMSRNGNDLGERFSRLAGFSETDIYFNDNGIVLSGYTDATKNDHLLFKYKTGRSSKISTTDVLPADVVLFRTIYKGVKEWNNRDVKDSVPGYLKEIKGYLGNEYTLALVRTGIFSDRAEPVSIFSLNNRNMAEFAVSSALPGSSIDLYEPDDQTRIPLYNSGYSGTGNFLSDGFTGNYSDSIISFWDNYMISGVSVEAVKKFLHDNILHNTLANNLEFRDFETTMPSMAGYYFYCIPSAVKGELKGLVSDSVFSFFQKYQELTDKIQVLGYQFAPSNGMIYNVASLKFGERKQDSGAEWETALDTAAAIKPFFFTNHITGGREIFVQDYRNNCYLINSTGRVLWKIKLNERIYTDVYMVDYYGNGKYQILCAGKNWLHLLDRNGNYVEKYPVKMRSASSAPPALFDYDGTLDYRILIPGEDRFIYAYDKTGNVVKGWKPFKTSSLVKTPVRFFRVSGKDYLVAADEGTVYFLDRTGSIRVNLREPVIPAKGSQIRLFTGRTTALVLSTPDGSVKMISFDGSVSKVLETGLSGDHSFDFFDVDGDGFGEYIFIDKGILYLYDDNRTELFRKDFGTDLLEGPMNFIFSASDRKTGVFDRSKRLIYLIDNSGSVVPGFPLRGASAFSIGKISGSEGYSLIVSGDNNFLYNYRIREGNR